MLKHNTAWTVKQHPGGALQWTSPTGRVYTDTPISTIEFAPDPEHEIPDEPVLDAVRATPDEVDVDFDFELALDELQLDPLDLIPF